MENGNTNVHVVWRIQMAGKGQLIFILIFILALTAVTLPTAIFLGKVTPRPMASVSSVFIRPIPVPTVRHIDICARISDFAPNVPAYYRDRTDPNIIGYFLPGTKVKIITNSWDWFQAYGWGIDAQHGTNAHLSGWIQDPMLQFVPCGA